MPLPNSTGVKHNAYMAFLANIPADRISRHQGQLGRAPFRGPLSLHNRQQAITIVANLFTWLQSARANPWMLVNQKLGDDKQQHLLP